MKKQDQSYPGLTFRSVSISILLLLVLAILIQFVSINDSWLHLFGSEPLAVPVVQILLLLLAVVALVKGLARFTVLTRPELLCIFYSLLIAAPLMGSGFWQRAVAASAAVVKGGSFDRYESLSPQLWPHGKNVLDNMVHEGNTSISSSGNVTWENVQILKGKEVTVPRLANTTPSQISKVQVSIPVVNADGTLRVLPGQPYLVTMLVRARGLGGQAYYYCRVFPDSSESSGREAFMSRAAEKKTYTNRYGFVRAAAYAFELPPQAQDRVVLEVGLAGEGVIDVAEMQLLDVTALEYAYRGKRSVSSDEYALLSTAQRTGVVCRPESTISLAGLKYYLGGHIPYKHWIPPLSRWILLCVLLLTAMFSIAAIMRRQWIQSERYPLPLAQVPFALIGEQPVGSSDSQSIWSDRLLWIGAGLAFLWCMSMIWHHWDPGAPDLRITIPLKSYFSDTGWGKTWNSINLQVYPLLFALGLFMELNVLMSLVLGFLLFRLQFWFGEANGLAANNLYPFEMEQTMGAYAGYALLTILFTRKYLWATLKRAIHAGKDESEVLSYRTSYLLLLASFCGAFFWAKWVGITVSGVLLFFVGMVLAGLVAMKIRAECGTPYHSFANSTLRGDFTKVFPLLGGVAMMGSDGMIFSILALIFFGVAFLNLPGIQLEMIEAGNRFKIRKGHIVGAAILGVIGAFVIGGWVYLSNTYGYGADNYFRSPGLFGNQGGMFDTYTTEMNSATENLVVATEQANTSPSRGVNPAVIGFGFGAIVTTVLTVLRQMFAGFWFHPVGYILGGTFMMETVWGSLLFAWIVRSAVLRMGGAVSVRTRLKPLAIGIVVGTMLAYAAATVINGYVFFFNNGAKEFRNFF